MQKSSDIYRVCVSLPCFALTILLLSGGCSTLCGRQQKTLNQNLKTKTGMANMNTKEPPAVNRFSAVQKKLTECKNLRIVVFGASNTDRYMPGIHWSDILHLGLRYTLQKRVWIINSGTSGNNTREALARFDQEVKAFTPDIVIVTLGGNDCNPRPEKFVPESEYRNNLRKIAGQVNQWGGAVIFQTYYKMDTEAMDPARAQGFLRNMEIIREEADANGWPLIDQYALFDKLDKEEFRYKYMLNAMHVNENGNILIGLEVLRHLGASVNDVPHKERLLPVILRHQELLQGN